MNNREVQEIELDLLKPFDGNRRIGGFDEAELEQLADSIKDIGVQQPAIVRRIEYPDLDSSCDYDGLPAFEIVAGERRWRASRLAGMETLPCMVKALSDVDALKIQLVENLQRSGVHPIDEADSLYRLTQEGMTVGDLAAEVGRSTTYIYQRLKLLELIPEAREAYLEGKITGAVALQIARLPEDAQRSVTDWTANGRQWTNEPVSAAEMSRYIEREVMLDLAKTAFKKDDAELVPKAGPCTTCPKRTGINQELFADMEQGDRCMDPGCFKTKVNAHVKGQLKRYEDQGEKLQKVYDGYISNPPKGSIPKWQVKECRKKDDGAAHMILVSGPQARRTFWGVKAEGYTYQREISAAETAAIERKQAYEAAEDQALKRAAGQLQNMIAVSGRRVLENRELLRMVVVNMATQGPSWTYAAKKRGWKRKEITHEHWTEHERPSELFLRMTADLEAFELERLFLELIMGNALEGGPGWWFAEDVYIDEVELGAELEEKWSKGEELTEDEEVQIDRYQCRIKHPSTTMSWRIFEAAEIPVSEYYLEETQDIEE